MGLDRNKVNHLISKSSDINLSLRVKAKQSVFFEHEIATHPLAARNDRRSRTLQWLSLTLGNTYLPGGTVAD